MTEKLPVGVDQPGLPDAIGEIKLTLPPSIRYALCSERLIITLVPKCIADAFVEPIITGEGATAATRSWEAQPAASDAKRMITGTILSIFHFHLMIFSDGAFWVELGRSLQFG